MVPGANSLLSSHMFWPEEFWAGRLPHSRGNFLWKGDWTRVESRTRFRTSDSYGPAYLACDTLQDVQCHLDENTHNMMCLEVPVVDMPK